MPKKPNIRRIVFKEFGLLAPKKVPFKEKTTQELHRFLRPYEEAKYPTRMAGDKTKLPIEFQRHGWGITPEAIANLLKNKRLARLVATDPVIREEFTRALRDAIVERGILAYEEEWAGLKGEDIKKRVVGRAMPQKIGKKVVKPTPYLANKFNSQLALPEIRKGIAKLKKGQHYVILDIGCGAGGTILPIVEKLSPKERSRLKLLLVDIMEAGLKEVRKELKRLGLKDDQIITVRENIATMLRNPKIKEFMGKVNFVTSGAAIHHTPDVTPIFSAVYKLLAKGGTFCFWDWGHAAWRAERLLVAPKGAIVDPTGRYWSRGIHEKEAPKEHAFISREATKAVTVGWAPTELQGVKIMLQTWISLLGYGKEEQARFAKWFDTQVKKGAPINFLEYLKKLEKKKPEYETPFLFWEGHKPPELYVEALRRSGFLSEKGLPYVRYSTQSPLLYQIKVKK